MKHLITILVIGLVISITILAQDNNDHDLNLELEHTQIVNEIVEGSPGTSMISPDGMLLAYARDIGEGGICIYNFDSLNTICVPYPQENVNGDPIRFLDPDVLRWSPDSTMIAIETDSLRLLEDSDMWVFSVETGEYTNYTEDNYDGAIIISEEARNIPIDILPTWSASGDLYFVRYTDLGDSIYTTELHSIRNNAGTLEEPTRVVDLTNETDQSFPFYNISGGFSLDGSAAVSPDETRLVLLFRSTQSDESDSIWIIDLQNGQVLQRILFTQETYQLGLFEEEYYDELQSQGISWVDNNTLIMTAINKFVLSMTWQSYRIGLDNEEISALFDFNDIVSLDDYFALDTDSPEPYFGILSPERTHLIFANRPNLTAIGVGAVSINDGEMMNISTFEISEQRRIPALFASSGNNGEIYRTLLGGIVYTFRMTE